MVVAKQVNKIADVVYTHAEKIQMPQIKNIRDKDVYNHLNKKQQGLFGIQYHEGRLYLNEKDISSRAVPIASYFPSHIKDNAVERLVFVSYLFAPTYANERNVYNTDPTPNGITLTSNLPAKKQW
jgi:hypothetical protein